MNTLFQFQLLLLLLLDIVDEKCLSLLLVLLLVALLVEVVVYDGLLERYDRFRHLDLTQRHLILQVGDTSNHIIEYHLTSADGLDRTSPAPGPR